MKNEQETLATNNTNTTARSNYYYLLSLAWGSILNIVLLISALKYLGFQGKSFVSVLFISIVGYFFKSLLFFLPFFRLNKDFPKKTKGEKLQLVFAPFLLLALWFGCIILFQLQSLSFEISYGYTDQFPHFYLQLLATLIVCGIIRNRVNKTYLTAN